MKSAWLFFASALFSGLLFSNCGPRGGLAAEEEAVQPEAYEMKQMRRSEFETREQELGWR